MSPRLDLSVVSTEKSGFQENVLERVYSKGRPQPTQKSVAGHLVYDQKKLTIVVTQW